MKLTEVIKLERKIIIAAIQSTKFLKQALHLIDIKWVQSKEARLILTWVFEYFNKYKKAPKSNIEDIYFEKLRLKKIGKKQAEIIETILHSLSEESKVINVEYVIDQTELYCKYCKIEGYADNIKEELASGNILEAEHMLTKYKPVENLKSNAVTPLKTTKQIKQAFQSAGKPLIKYPGQLGDFLNQHMVAEGFVVFMGQNKGGKSFILQDAAFRAAKQGKNVLFYQAGDMSQSQMERRQAIYLAKKSDLRKFCGTLYVPILDCAYNQNGECELEYRESPDDYDPPFDGMSAKQIRNEIPAFELRQAYSDFSDHVVCYNCLRRKKPAKFKGTIWYKKRKPVEPLDWKQTYHILKKKYKSVMDRIQLITYPSESLTMSKLRAEAEILEKKGFFPHVVIADYMDLLASDRDTLHYSRRDQENSKWQRARGFSQEKKCLFLSGTQSDSEGFDIRFLKKKNFSEDRRKLDHVTAMLGLNMSIDEKIKGIMRINDINSRESEGTEFVHVLHRLQMGRPVLGSFY